MVSGQCSERFIRVCKVKEALRKPHDDHREPVKRWWVMVGDGGGGHAQVICI